MIPSSSHQSYNPPRPHNKVDFQNQLKELTSDMRQLRLDEKGALSNVRFIDIVVDLAFGPGIDEVKVVKELTSWLIYAKSKNLVEASDIQAIQDLAFKAKITPEKRSTEIERELDDVMNQIRHLDPETALDDLYTAIKNSDEFTIDSIIKNNLPALQAAMQMSGNSTPLHTAVSTNNKRFIQLLVEHLPKEFKAAMLETDAEGLTPLSLASDKGLNELVKIMALHAPDEFKKAVLMGDKDGNTPIHRAKLSALEMIAEYAPKEFIIGLETLNDFEKNPVNTQRDYLGVTKFFYKKHPALFLQSKIGKLPPISYIKASRPENYRANMDIFKTNEDIVNIAKEISRIKAASHAFHIEGVTSIRQKNSDINLVLDLEGHHMPQWFHLMKKTLDKFEETYPGILTKDEIDHLKGTFKQNSTSASSAKIIKRIKAGLPTIVQAGFGNEESGGHAVIFLFLGNRLIICNRGAGAETALNIYHYDPEKLDLRTFIKISMVERTGGLEDYERLITEVLPEDLHLSKTEYDIHLEECSEFPDQTVGNCSFISPITSVYALLLFEALEKKHPANDLELGDLITATLDKYQKWLGFLQITILERLIKPLLDQKHKTIADQSFIREVLKNAHSLELDDRNESKLEDITTLYQTTLDKTEANLLKVELIAWKKLPKNPIL